MAAALLEMLRPQEDWLLLMQDNAGLGEQKLTIAQATRQLTVYYATFLDGGKPQIRDRRKCQFMTINSIGGRMKHTANFMPAATH